MGNVARRPVTWFEPYLSTGRNKVRLGEKRAGSLPSARLPWWETLLPEE